MSASHVHPEDPHAPLFEAPPPPVGSPPPPPPPPEPADPLARYAKARLRAEIRRRAALRAILKGLPGPGEWPEERRGASRPELWPPRPPRPPQCRPGRRRKWPRAALVECVRRFAARRGPDFSVTEFCRWLGIASCTLYACGRTWPDLRREAGLPPNIRRPDARRANLHRLLEALHRYRYPDAVFPGVGTADRTRPPLTADRLAAAAGVSRGVVQDLGGVRHLRELLPAWVRLHRDRRAGRAEPTGGRRDGRRQREAEDG